MKLNDCLDQAPYGTAKELAAKAGMSPSYLYQVRTGRRPMPLDRVFALCKATDWVVTPHDLLPSVYPHPDDSLPASLRTGSAGAATHTDPSPHLVVATRDLAMGELQDLHAEVNRMAGRIKRLEATLRRVL